MATLTQVKRDHFPERYARKDARTLIYRALYGRPEPGKRSNVPELDTRRIPYHWDYQNAEAVFKAQSEAAQFTPEQAAHLQRRLDTLKHYKPSH